MAVGDEHGFDFFLVIFEIAEIRNDHLDAELVGFGIFHSAFHDEYIIIVLNDIHVLAVLIQAAKGKYADFTHIIFPPFSR